MLGLTRRFQADEAGAIGPLYAIGLFVLVGMAGVGFDYGRLMALDSELQNAADQAALAAATQLNGEDDAITRARAAVADYFADADSDFVNETRMANDGGGRPIVDLTVRFYDDYDDDQPGDEITNDADGAEARVVQVTVNGREAFFALTPIIGAISSGDVIGSAMAGLVKATCEVPPLMFCVPNPGFGTDDDRGTGIKLHLYESQDDSLAPGNFGFLDIDYTSGRPNTRMGLNESVAGCVGGDIESEPGNRASETKAFNTRFDMYESPAPSCSTGSGNYCPAQNVRKDWVRVETRNNVRPEDVAGLTCSSASTGAWTRVEDIPAASRPPDPGFPRDSCFTGGTCSVVGDGTWAGDAFMTNNHSGTSLSTAAPNGTRYEVYQWELENPGARLPVQKVGETQTLRANGNYNVDLYCSYPQPFAGTGVTPSATQKDRRLLTVAAVDCTGLNGRDVVDILRWVDLFLVQPANIGGPEKEFFAEVVGQAREPDGSSGFQKFGRNRAVLIR